MAFTFDADPVSATMNSYVSVEDADDFFASKFIPADSEQWLDLDAVVKHQLLCTATRTLDAFVYGGLKKTKTQPLQWPRSGMYNDEGTAWPDAVVPVPMKQATCEQAYWLWTEGSRTLDDTTLLQFEDFKAGPLSVKIRKNALTDVSREALALIKSMGQGTLISTNRNMGATSMTMKL